MTLLIAMLATYRISRMIALEDGPYDAFRALRTLVYDRWQSGIEDPTWIWRGINCPLCVSFWVGIIVAGLMQLDSGAVDAGIFALAVSGGATWIYKMEAAR